MTNQFFIPFKTLGIIFSCNKFAVVQCASLFKLLVVQNYLHCKWFFTKDDVIHFKIIHYIESVQKKKALSLMEVPFRLFSGQTVNVRCNKNLKPSKWAHKQNNTSHIFDLIYFILFEMWRMFSIIVSITSH